MSSRPIPTGSPDVLAAILPIVQAAMPSGVNARRTRTSAAREVTVRADLQGHATPISRYCRVGITAWHLDTAGNSRIDLALALANTAAKALLDSRAQAIISAEWQSGPLDTLDPV